MKRLLKTGAGLFAMIITLGNNSCEVKEPDPGGEGIPDVIGNYYVSVNGYDTSPGTFSRPFKTLEKAIAVVKPGELIYIRGGVYYTAANKGSGLSVKNKNGEANKNIKIWAYPHETPILDCKNQNIDNVIVGLDFSGNYWHFKGIEIRNATQHINPSSNCGFLNKGILAMNCHHNIFENMSVHDMSGIGMSIGGDSDDNLMLNCDFFNNYDPYSCILGNHDDGGNGDGIDMEIANKSSVNTFRGCRFWWNSDDGLDLWYNEGTVIMDSCWSFWNGYKPGTFESKGDGNGFKFGKTLTTMNSSPQRIITHCMSVANLQNGYDQNAANVLMEFYNNIAYKNGSHGFSMDYFPLNHDVKNNVSFGNNNGKSPDSIFSDETEQSNNSWNLGIIPEESDFLSLDFNELTGKRKDNGSLPEINFLKLSSMSRLIDKGEDVGLPFLGSAPDLGAGESK